MPVTKKNSKNYALNKPMKFVENAEKYMIVNSKSLNIHFVLNDDLVFTGVGRWDISKTVSKKSELPMQR